MGENQSKPDGATSQLLSREWRTINWGDNQAALHYVKNYKPQVEGRQLRILLHGPVGAGKSSLINSVQSIVHGRMYKQALAANVFEDCFTKKYTTYKIHKESPTTFCSFVFNDIMGLGSDKGVLVEDIKLALEGHVTEGYKFNSESPLSKEDMVYRQTPDLNDQVHVLVCVVPANTLSQIRDSTMQKIQEIRAVASRLEIPQLIILTKIDEVCPEIKEDLKNIYKIKNLKKMMEQISADVGIPMNCIFPVKNYHEEIDLNTDMDSLILSVLRDIIHCGDDFLNFKHSREARTQQ